MGALLNEPWDRFALTRFLSVISKRAVYVQMTNLRRNGTPSSHNIRFYDFLKDDPRYLLFLMAFNDNNLHGDVKSNPGAELCWHMPTTKEIYNVTGRFYIVSSPLKITRFPAPKVGTQDMPASDYWESSRRKTWMALNPQTRAQFAWPPPGEPMAGREAFRVQRIDGMIDSNDRLRGPTHPDRIAHDTAFDNFCLLVFKVTEVVRFEYGAFPPARTTYTYSEEQHAWNTKDLNP